MPTRFIWRQQHCLLTLALLRLEDPAQALQMAELAARIDPKNEWPQRLRSVILLRLDRNDEAHEAAREAVRLGPHVPEALCSLVRAELASGRISDARVTAERMVATAPDLALSHVMLGNVALKQGAFRGAEEHYRHALALAPQSGEAMNYLGVALQRQGKERQAVERFYDAARIAPTDPTAQKNLRKAITRYVGPSRTTRYVAIAIMIPLILVCPPLRPLCLIGLFIPYVHPTRLLTRLVNAVFVRWRKRRSLPPAVLTFYGYRQGVTNRCGRVGAGSVAGALLVLALLVVWLASRLHGVG
jgi:Flp pilus assembly protein TadD